MKRALLRALAGLMFALSLAACSAPALTACQNWCWKPFEMSGM